MKSIKTLITTSLFFMTLFGLSAQNNGSINVGMQYFSGEYKISNFGTKITEEFAGTMLALGAEYKYGKFLPGEVYLGVLGRQGTAESQLKFLSAQISPIRLHIGKDGIGGFYIGPKIFMQSVSDSDGATINGVELGGSLGFNIVSKKIPIVIGLNTSLSPSRFTNVRRIGSGIISIGYQL